MLNRCIVQRPHYLAWTTPPCPAVLAAYTTFDTGVMEGAAALVRHDGFLASSAATLQATLPPGQGGLGCRSLARVCRPAFLGSWAQRFLHDGRPLLQQVLEEVATGSLPFQEALRSAQDGLLAEHPALAESVVPFAHLAHTSDSQAQARYMAA
eukprot:SM010654S14180  [mRNA]  locus=s10654:17:493:- [translate_table: standard]